MDEWPNPKAMPWPEALRRRAALRAGGTPLVLTNGCFDLLHPGHLFFLQRARALGGALWVALNSDESVRALKGPRRPVLSEQWRAHALAALACVDGVFVFRTPRLDAEIAALRPERYAKAGDYRLETLDAGERAALQAAGTEIHFLPFLPGFSTTALIESLAQAGGTA